MTLVNQSSTVFSKNRAEEFGYDVWNEFVIPLFYDQLELRDAKKGRIIIGGRGCGKTMLLRYLSHYSQFSKNRNHIENNEVEYIGLYWKADTHFASLMAGREINKDKWRIVFDHVLALIISRELLNSIETIADSNCKSISLDDLINFRFTSLHEFDNKFNSDWEGFRGVIQNKLRQLQMWVNNPGKIEEPIFIPGKEFSLAVIDEIKKNLKNLSSSNFFLYIDEYENLLGYQQEIINTYIKHSEMPLIFNVAMKRNGMKERGTLGDEKITNISDYRINDLDELLDNNNFPVFAAEVLFLRLKNNVETDLPIKKEILRNPNELNLRLSENYQKKVLEYVNRIFPSMSHSDVAKTILSESSAYNLLKRKIERALEQKKSKLAFDDFKIDDFSAMVVLPCLLFRKKNSPEEILAEIENLKLGKENKFYGKTGWVHNYSFASLLQISSKSKSLPILFSGFETFICLARGNMRHILELCHQSLKRADLTRLPDLCITQSEQAEAARQVSAQLVHEIRSSGNKGNQLHSFVLTLGTIFQIIQNRLEISEPEVNHFSIKEEGEPLSIEELDLLNEAVKWSVLIEEAETKVKNPLAPSQRTQYVLNPIYSPYFQISYRKKRKLEIKSTDIKTILFGTESERKKIISNYDSSDKNNFNYSLPLWV